MTDRKNGFIEILKNGTSLQTELNLLFPQNISTYMDNLTSMGILDISHNLHKMDDDIYNKLYEQYEFEKVNESYTKRDVFSRVEKKTNQREIRRIFRVYTKRAIKHTRCWH